MKPFHLLVLGFVIFMVGANLGTDGYTQAGDGLVMGSAAVFLGGIVAALALVATEMVRRRP